LNRKSNFSILYLVVCHGMMNTPHHTPHHSAPQYSAPHHSTTLPHHTFEHSPIYTFWSILVHFGPHINIETQRSISNTKTHRENTQRFINLFFISTSTILMLMFKTTIALATLAALTNGQTPPSKHEIKSLPGWSPAALPSAMYTGYLNAG
jgi:hypothetical protein